MVARDSAIRAVSVARSELSDYANSVSFDSGVELPETAYICDLAQRVQCPVDRESTGVKFVKPKDWDTWSEQIIKPDMSITTDNIKELNLRGYLQVSRGRQRSPSWSTRDAVYHCSSGEA